MFITLSFSTFVYIGVERATRLALEGQRRRLEKQIMEVMIPQKGFRAEFIQDAQTLLEIKYKTLTNLVGVNILVLIASGSLGYILAGKTLTPIENTVKKQKRFISDAAHEMKTPLTAMKTELEVTLRDSNLNLEESRKALASTVEEVDKLHSFINKLLDQSRYQNGNRIKHKAVELDKLLNQIVTKLKPIADKKSETLNLTIQPLKINGDKDALEKLFTNLIENAIKYSYHNQTINLTLKRIGTEARFIVQDYGQGISEEDLPYIFEPFFRADKSRTASAQEGYGLGLAISKEIIEKHQGNITVRSKPNEGTTFTVTLPTLII